MGDYALAHFNEFDLNEQDELFLAECFQNPETVKQICAGTVADCIQLFSTQEEADTRIILQSLFANEQLIKSNSRGRIVIKSSDTDVLLLCIRYFPKMTNIDELWFQTGCVSSTKDARRFIPVHHIYKPLD